MVSSRPSRAIRAARRAVLENAIGTQAALEEKFSQIGFVQADPIRAPARAQDLILRHRIVDYRAGQLEREYYALGAEEDFVYAYGFTTPEIHSLLHPRGGRKPAGIAREILAFVRDREATHPRDLVTVFGAKRETNAWGGESRATTKALQLLHYFGHVRVVRRERGIRLWGVARDRGERLTPTERLTRLTLLLAANFAPLPEASLRNAVTYLRWGAPTLKGRSTIVTKLLKAGALASGDVEGVRYVWPADHSGFDISGTEPEEPGVRFLAPFDPIIWNRRRLEQLWDWDYRFEAYTPAARRRFGYYALPMLYGDDFIGWVNLSMRKGVLSVDRGFRESPPRSRAFAQAFDAEVERFRAFMSAGA
jgi:uncharacterized protein